MTLIRKRKDTGKHEREQAESPITKALIVAEAVARSPAPIRFTALLESVPYPKATLYRLLRMLVGERILSYDEDRQTYRVGPRLIRMAYTAWRTSDLLESARPVLDRMVVSAGGAVELAQLDDGQVLYLDRRASTGGAPSTSGPGKVGPAYCTALGKVMLAFLAESALSNVLPKQAFHGFTPNTLVEQKQLIEELTHIRTTGYAFENEEHAYGVIAVAVPIRAADGALYGALGMAGSSFHTSLEVLESRVPELITAAAEAACEAQVKMIPALG